MEKVSIIMLSHKNPQFIKVAIKSIEDQTFKDWHLYIVNSDPSQNNFLRSLTSDNISLILNGRPGQISYNRNIGINVSSGEYIAILDNDDIWNDSTKLEKQISFLDEHNDCGVVGTFVIIIDEQGREIKRTSFETDHSLIHSKMLGRYQLTHSSALIRRSAIGNGYNTHRVLAEDLDLFVRIGNRWKLANIPEYMTSYRLHSSGVSKQRKLTMSFEILRIVLQHPFNKGFIRALIIALARIVKSFF